MSSTATSTEAYTKYPNRYTDKIKPRLTDTQRDVCDVVIRLTYGWHQSSARISNTEFERRTGKTKRAIINAKKQLREMGLLVEVTPGGGSRTTEYSINLWYDREPGLPSQGEHGSEPDELDEQEISCHVEMPKAGENRECAECTGEPSSPPYKENTGNNTGGKRKQTVKKNSEHRKAVAIVRNRFSSFFPQSVVHDDWQFFGWAAKQYGLDACLSQIDYMKEHGKRHEITNPKGFFRTALLRDFRPPAFIAAKLEGDERASRAVERSQTESDQWRRMTKRFDYDSAAAALQNLLDSLN